MSKPNSFLFNKTLGAKISQYTRISVSIDTNPSESDIIASRVKGFDLHEHPYKYKQLSRKKMVKPFKLIILIVYQNIHT